MRLLLACALLVGNVFADTTIQLKTNTVEVTPTITAGAYSDGDIVGGLLTFPDATKIARTGLLVSAELVDEADQGAAIDVTCFSASVTVAADNAANALSDDDARKVVASFSIATTDYKDHGGVKIASKQSINDAFRSSDGKLYCQMVLNGSTPTYAATNDVTLKIDVLQD